MGERELIGLAGVIVFILLTALRVPVALGMLIVGIGGSYALSLAAPFLRFEPYLLQFKTLFFSTVANYELSVVPLFILMGYLAAAGQLSRDLFQGLNALIGHIRGGLAMAAVAACAGFGAVSGSSLATASAMGKIALPQLRTLKYSEDLATGALAAGGTLGILIPPSVALVLYAVIVDASIIEMFQAAVVPGVLAVTFFIALIAFLVRAFPHLAPEARPMPRDEANAALRRLIPAAAIFLAMIAGLGLGLFTPTPAAAIGVFAVFCYGLVRHRLTGEGLTRKGIRDSVLSAAVTAGMIYFIIFGAEILKGFFARTGLPGELSEMAGASGIDPWLILVLVLVVLIILGCVMESLSMILVVVPFFWPVMLGLNGGPDVLAADAAFGMTSDELRIWFGILCLVVVELGLITPPIGLNVFAIKSLTPMTPMTTIFRGVMPFFGVELLRVALLLAIPALTLALPYWLGR